MFWGGPESESYTPQLRTAVGDLSDKASSQLEWKKDGPINDPLIHLVKV